MEQFETRFKQVDVLPMVKHYMDQLGLFDLFSKYVPSTTGHLAEHAEGLCVLTANIICDNKPLYKVQEWSSTPGTLILPGDRPVWLRATAHGMRPPANQGP